MSPLSEEEHEHFSGGAQLAFAVVVDLTAIFVAVLWLSSSYFLSAISVGVGAIITGLLVRKPVGKRAMWICFVIAVVVIILGIAFQMSVLSF